MSVKRSTILVVFSVVLTVGQAFGKDLCEGTAPETDSWVTQKLNEAKAARDQGNYLRSSELLYFTATGFPRTADVSLPVRCMGQRNWQRYYRERQQTYFELGRAVEGSDINAGSREGLAFYIEGDNREDIERLLNKLPDDPKLYAFAGNAIRNNLSDYQRASDQGFTLISEEQAGKKYYQARLDRLIAQSRSRGNALLGSEEKIISSDMSDEEAMAKSTEESAMAVIGTMIGDSSAIPINEARIDVERARRSLNQLREAKQWLGWITDTETAPVLMRAEQRGDVLLDRANDTTVGLEGRDDYYAAAIRYLELAGVDQKVEAAESSRKAIETALEQKRALRSTSMDQKADELREQAEEFRQSVEKSNAEKEAFKSEADALEAELDF